MFAFYVHGGQRTNFRSRVLPSMIWVLGIKLKLPGLLARPFTYWAISSAQCLLGIDFVEYCYTKLTVHLLLRRAENSAEGWGGIPNNRIEGWNTDLWYVVCASV